MHSKNQFRNLRFRTISCAATTALVLVFALTVVATQPAQAQYGGCAICLYDNFTIWTTDSPFLTALARASSNPPAAFVSPTLGFGQSGLEMSGPTQDYQTTGMQSLRAFSAPFTFTTFATATQGTADPIELFLANSDLTQYLTVTVSFNPTYNGIWADATNIAQLWQLGEQFQPPISPAFNTLYEFIVTVDGSGNATVTVKAQGTVLGTLSNLTPGTGPFYVVLGQRIGDAPPGSQAASWKSVSLNP